MRERTPCSTVAYLALGLSIGLLVTAGNGGAARAHVPSRVDGLIAFQRNEDQHGVIWVLDPPRRRQRSRCFAADRHNRDQATEKRVV
jgi:hypothetical protein